MIWIAIAGVVLLLLAVAYGVFLYRDLYRDEIDDVMEDPKRPPHDKRAGGTNLEGGSHSYHRYH